MKKIILLLLLLATGSCVWASKNNLTNPIDESESLPHTFTNLVTQFDSIGKFEQRDSCIASIYKSAEFDLNEHLKFEVSSFYFSFKSFPNEYLTTKLFNELKQIVSASNNNEWIFQYHKVCYLNPLNQTIDKKNIAEKMSYYAMQTNNYKNSIEANLCNGDEFDKMNQKPEAFKLYLDALYTSNEHDDLKLEMEVYDHIYDFFYKLKLFEKAKYYLLQEFKISNTIYSKQSKNYFVLLSKYSDISFKLDDEELGIKIADSVIQFAQQHNLYELQHEIFTIYRSNYVIKKQYNKLRDLYLIKYPNELSKLKQHDTILFTRVMAHIYDAENKIDSSLLMFNYAETFLLKKDSSAVDNAQFSNFYNRYASELIKSKLYDKAVLKAELAFNYAKKSNFIPFIIDNAAQLDSLYYKIGNIQEAYKYNQIYNVYKDSFNKISIDQNLLLIEFNNSEKQKELEELRAEEKVTKQHNIEYLAIVIFIATSFIVLLLFGIFKVNKFVIKALGYVSFIFFFEFIILLTDNWIHHVTHGAPLKILGFKIVLISIMLPFHHWVEETVVHYLLKHKLVDTDGVREKLNNFFKRIKSKIRDEELDENEAMV